MGEGGEGAGFTLVRRGVRRVGPDGARASGQKEGGGKAPAQKEEPKSKMVSIKEQ